MANIENLINSVANKLGRHEAEKKQIKEFLKNHKNWQEHLKECGFETTCVDLNEMFGFGGTVLEQEEFNKFYLKMECGGKNG